MIITLALSFHNMPVPKFPKTSPTSGVTERLLVRIHLLRSIVLRLLLPRSLRRQFVRVVVRPLRWPFGRFAVETLLGLAGMERVLWGVPEVNESYDLLPELLGLGEPPG